MNENTRNWKRHPFTPEVGTIYCNRNGNEYICTAVPEYGVAIMERLSDGYTLNAHNPLMYEDGTIEWDYSTGGYWPRRD